MKIFSGDWGTKVEPSAKRILKLNKMAAFEKAQALVGLSEGGYQNEPRDSGNYYNGVLIGTNWGIAAPTLATFLGRTPTAQEMRGLTKTVAESILKMGYWTKNNLGQIKNQSVANLLYDGVVNHGTNGMRMIASKALSAMGAPLEYYLIFTLDGIKHLNRLNNKRLFFALKKARTDKYKSLGKPHYLKGWLNRLDRIKYFGGNSLAAIWPILPIILVGLLLIGIAL